MIFIEDLLSIITVKQIFISYIYFFIQIAYA